LDFAISEFDHLIWVESDDNGTFPLPVMARPAFWMSGTSLLDSAKALGFPIPTLMEGLTSYGACRLCLVEIDKGPKAKLVSSCTYPAEEGLVVRRGFR
jgi:predicted molibdopterin-dependent oxidoreductase YjgC